MLDEVEGANVGRTQTTDEKISEILDRVRRTETRATATAIAVGAPVRSERPVWSASRAEIHIPTPQCSLKEILDAIPRDWNGNVDVRVGKHTIATLCFYREP